MLRLDVLLLEDADTRSSILGDHERLPCPFGVCGCRE